ncbi:MAG TPA: right-handed parallel beta-helix repeat-containing protein, partial [Solirubrobacteraceae bacterium]|nr:right-handed parallel beta-helix repeat-containing protein [Solirubrobacteraceae bacterium]
MLPVLLGAWLGLGAGTAGAMVGGPICNVPADYPTIQLAVSVPLCTTVEVAPGTYKEHVVIGHTLTLKGAQAGVDARARSGPESIITNSEGPVQVLADNVVVNGFTIEGATSDPTTDPAALGAGIWTNPSFYGGHGGTQILDNIIQNNIAGVYLNNGTNPAKVQFNLFKNNNAPGAGEGNGIDSEFLSNALIDNNTFSGDTSTSVLVLDQPGDEKITVSNNELVGGSSERVFFANVKNSSIVGNTSIGSTSSATVRLAGGDSNVAVNGNVLANGVRGIRVDNPFEIGPNSGVTAHQNCIENNSLAGLEEDTPEGYSPVAPGSLEATNNWWGSSTGPTIASNPGGTGDKIIDQEGVVGYKPWLTSQPPAPCPIVFTKLASGSFVIGDKNATVGSNVTFSEVEWWGSNWWKENSLSGGQAPSAFKGFAESSPSPPTC